MKHAQISYIQKLNSLILIKHTLFTLLWLVSLALLGVRAHAVHASLQTWAYLLLAYFSARTSGMCFNRLIDKELDAKNPRTASRALPQKKVSERFTLLQAFVFLFVMFFSVFCLGTHVYTTAVLLAFFLVGYSYTKRITAFCHLILGSIYFVALICFWQAIAQSDFQIPILLGLSLCFSIAAGDILYGALDFRFDRAHAIKSIPALVGIENAVKVAKVFHVVSVIFLVMLSRYFSGIMFIASLLVACVYILSYFKEGFEERFRFANTYSGVVFLLFSIIEFVWHG